jgi:hypothetical protein
MRIVVRLLVALSVLYPLVHPAHALPVCKAVTAAPVADQRLP